MGEIKNDGNEVKLTANASKPLSDVEPEGIQGKVKLPAGTELKRWACLDCDVTGPWCTEWNDVIMDQNAEDHLNIMKHRICHDSMILK